MARPVCLMHLPFVCASRLCHAVSPFQRNARRAYRGKIFLSHIAHEMSTSPGPAWSKETAPNDKSFR
eukprot:2807876-Lingulodinium_polyedra.AAC.1